MSGSAVVMMLVAMAVIWGGLALAVVSLLALPGARARAGAPRPVTLRMGHRRDRRAQQSGRQRRSIIASRNTVSMSLGSRAV